MKVEEMNLKQWSMSNEDFMSVLIFFFGILIGYRLNPWTMNHNIHNGHIPMDKNCEFFSTKYHVWKTKTIYIIVLYEYTFMTT